MMMVCIDHLLPEKRTLCWSNMENSCEVPKGKKKKVNGSICKSYLDLIHYFFFVVITYNHVVWSQASEIYPVHCLQDQQVTGSGPLWWSGSGYNSIDLSGRSLGFSFSSLMSWQLSDGLLWNLVQTVVVLISWILSSLTFLLAPPSSCHLWFTMVGWIIIEFVMHLWILWLFISHQHTTFVHDQTVRIKASFVPLAFFVFVFNNKPVRFVLATFVLWKKDFFSGFICQS